MNIAIPRRPSSSGILPAPACASRTTVAINPAPAPRSHPARFHPRLAFFPCNYVTFVLTYPMFGSHYTLPPQPPPANSRRFSTCKTPASQPPLFSTLTKFSVSAHSKRLKLPLESALTEREPVTTFRFSTYEKQGGTPLTPGPPPFLPSSGRTPPRQKGSAAPPRSTPAGSPTAPFRVPSAPTGTRQSPPPSDSARTATATAPAPANSDTPPAKRTSRIAAEMGLRTSHRDTARSARKATAPRPAPSESPAAKKTAAAQTKSSAAFRNTASHRSAPQTQWRNPPARKGPRKAAAPAAEKKLS